MPRTPLWKRLPQIWHRLDMERDGNGNVRPGVAERFLGVVDSGFDRAHGKATALLDLRSVDRIPDRYLELLGELVGHRWRSARGSDWNRRRIRDSIRRYSYRGTLEALRDLVREHGGGAIAVQDNASKLMVLGLQGRLGEADCHLQAADFWHDGAFVLRITDHVDWPALRSDLTDALAAGEVWFVEIAEDILAAFEAWPNVAETVLEADTNAFEGRLGLGQLGLDLFLSFGGSGRQRDISEPVYWDSDTDGMAGRLGIGRLGEDLFLSFEGMGSFKESSSPVYWDAETDIDRSGLGLRRLGVDLFLSFEPSPDRAAEAMVEAETGVAGASLTVDSVFPITSTVIDVTMGSGTNPLPEHLAVWQLDGKDT